MNSTENDPSDKAATPDIGTSREAAIKKETGWDQADRKLFMVTFYGGLAANLGVVMAVGAAIATDRYMFGHHNYPLGLRLVVVLAFVAFGFLAATAIDSIAPNVKTWLTLVIAYALLGLLILIGYVAGIK